MTDDNITTSKHFGDCPEIFTKTLYLFSYFIFNGRPVVDSTNIIRGLVRNLINSL